MKIFDCDVAYGRGAVALPRELDTIQDLRAELERCGIDEALVWHRDAFERGFQCGNQRLHEVAEQAALHPALTMVPTCCNEMPSADAFINQMKDGGVRAVRAFPARHYFVLDPVSCGDLFEAYAANHVPLFVPLAEFPNGWHGVYTLLRLAPDLTLVVTETGCWGQDRFFRPLMARYPNFHITTSRLETAGQLSDLVRVFGPDRILFGSGLPFNNPGGSIMMLARAAIADAAKEAVAHKNIERLLAEVPW